MGSECRKSRHSAERGRITATAVASVRLSVLSSIGIRERSSARFFWYWLAPTVTTSSLFFRRVVALQPAENISTFTNIGNKKQTERLHILLLFKTYCNIITASFILHEVKYVELFK